MGRGFCHLEVLLSEGLIDFAVFLLTTANKNMIFFGYICDKPEILHLGTP